MINDWHVSGLVVVVMGFTAWNHDDDGGDRDDDDDDDRSFWRLFFRLSLLLV